MTRPFVEWNVKKILLYMEFLKTKSPRHRSRYSQQAWLGQDKTTHPVLNGIYERSVTAFFFNYFTDCTVFIKTKYDMPFLVLLQYQSMSLNLSMMDLLRLHYKFILGSLMPDSLYGVRLQGIMVDVFIKPCMRLINDEYNYCESLQARAIEGIEHWARKMKWLSSFQRRYKLI